MLLQTTTSANGPSEVVLPMLALMILDSSVEGMKRRWGNNATTKQVSLVLTGVKQPPTSMAQHTYLTANGAWCH